MTGDLYRKSDSTNTSEVLPPEIKIIQGTTRDYPAEAKQGQFLNPISGEFFDSFEFIYVDRDKTRTYWGRDTVEDEPPLCWSPDSDDNQSADGKDCRKCEFRLDNAASVKADVRKTKCLIHYTIKGIKLPNWEPFMMRVTGISVGEFMRLMTNFLYNPKLRNPETGKPMYHTVVIPVSTVKTTTPSGISYALKFGMFKPIVEPEIIGAAFSVSANLLGQPDAVLMLDEGTEIPDSEGTVQAPAPQAPAPPAPKINEIPAASQATKDAETLYEGNKGTPAKVFVGYLANGKEVYADDLVPAGSTLLKTKPAAPVTPAKPPAPPAVAKPPTPAAAAMAKPPANPAQIDLNSL